MESSNIIKTPKPLFQKEIQILSDKNDEIYLTFELENSSILIKAINKSKINNNFFSTSMSFEEFKQKNRYFNQFDDINEICQELNERIKPNNMKLLQNTNSLVLTVLLPSTKFTEISFSLKEKEKSDKEKINELYTIVENYHKENEMLKKEIEEIKKYIFKLKEEQEEKKKNQEKKKLINNFDSLIVQEKEKIKILKNWISPEKEINAELLYRLSRDGESFSTFHQLCDNKGPTITLFKTFQNIVIGFYSPLSFDSQYRNFKEDMDTFIFNLNKSEKFVKIRKNGSIYCQDTFGPYVAYLGMWSGSCKNMRQCYYNPSGTKDNFNNGNSIIQNENMNITFDLNEVEIWRINI